MVKHKLRACLWVLLPASLIAGAWVWRGGVPPFAHKGPRMEEWDAPRLVERLRASGLEFRVTPTARNGEVKYSAFLTESDRPWEELTCLRMVPECVDDWRGVVYFEKVPAYENVTVRVDMAGDACLYAPPFWFFGDPALRARIEAALRDDEP